jgi:hypothetical protein
MATNISEKKQVTSIQTHDKITRQGQVCVATTSPHSYGEPQIQLMDQEVSPW